MEGELKSLPREGRAFERGTADARRKQSSRKGGAPKAQNKVRFIKDVHKCVEISAKVKNADRLCDVPLPPRKGRIAKRNSLPCHVVVEVRRTQSYHLTFTQPGSSLLTVPSDPYCDHMARMPTLCSSSNELWERPLSTYALRGRGGVKEMTNFCVR